MNITVWERNQDPEWEDLFSTPSYVHGFDWFGSPSKRGPLSSYIVISPMRIWWAFSCSGPVSTVETANPGKQFEGLWEHDVAELFVGDPSSDQYVEWNLGPQGAWWGCAFDAYRVRHEVIDAAKFDVRTFSERNSAGWRGAMSYLRGPDCSLFGRPHQLQFCAIMDSPDQSFFSSRLHGGGDPDFHLRANFQAVVIGSAIEGRSKIHVTCPTD